MAGQGKKSTGAPRWMATFADLSTLLLTFFIIMLSMANVDIEEFREMLGSVKNAFGVQIQKRGNYQAVVEEGTPVVTVQNNNNQRRESSMSYGGEIDYESEVVQTALERADAWDREKQQQAASEIDNAIRQSGMGEMAEILSGSKGIRVRVKGALLFAPGMADLKAQAKPFLDDVISVLKKFDYFLLVEGHTDSIPISTERFPSNWELSGARASAVLRYLIDANIDPRRLISVGLSDNYPLASNTTSEGRGKNRRVEFIMTKNAFRPEID